MLADFAVDIFRGIKMRYGVGMIIDATPIDLGRDILLIKEVSERSEIPMAASAGLYHYPSLYTARHSEILQWYIIVFLKTVVMQKIGKQSLRKIQ